MNVYRLYVTIWDDMGRDHFVTTGKMVTQAQGDLKPYVRAHIDI